MTDIVERLRACEDDPMWADHAEIPKLWCKQAADEIERLEAKASQLASTLATRMLDTSKDIEIERLREEVKRYRGILTSLRVQWID